ncbi:hypothetical protein D3C87_129770 [compost metagenome]
MKIAQTDYKQLLDYMVDKRWQGYEYVACEFWNGPVTKDELYEFQSHSEGKEFCEEHATDSDRYGYLPIRSVYRAMSEALQDTNLVVEHGGLVDILSVVNTYHNKL